jgi:outer membrane protein OmpA-like peptidoglycan-associated protein
MRLSKRDTAVVVSSFLLSLGLSGTARGEVETRSTLALTYREGSGSQVDMVGTGATRGNLGKADVKRSEGRTRVKLKLEALPHPQTLGSFYTTYMLWAVAPEGRAESLAELPHSEKFDVDATTSLPTFGLIVTAEPDSAVTRPGPKLIAQNAANEDTKGRIQTGQVEYETADERVVSVRGGPDFQTPLPVLGARRAVELAQAAGAARFAADELREAEVKLATAEQLASGHKKLSKEADIAARDAMRLAEHARGLTGEREEAAGLARERRAARRAINQATSAAEVAQDEAARAGAQASSAQAQASQAQAQAAQAQAQAAMERQQAEQARNQADDAMLETAKAKASVMEAQSEADRARLEAQQARQDQAALQEQLYQSLSAVLETRREARGLIVNLSDVLFDFNKATLTPGAREKLSKLAGILIAYPGTYRIDIEGHTDSVGSPEYNESLSRGRAQSVSSYVAQAGIRPDRIGTVTGFGETRPVASNDSAAGRQQNRRVELVIGGLEGQ